MSINNSYCLLSGLSFRYEGIENVRLSLFSSSKREADKAIPPKSVEVSSALPSQFTASELATLVNKYGGEEVVLGQAYELLS